MLNKDESTVGTVTYTCYTKMVHESTVSGKEGTIVHRQLQTFLLLQNLWRVV